jgi:hypothetical protein
MAYYLVMEYVEGVDAQRLLDREGRQPHARSEIAVVAAPGEAHDQNVIHAISNPQTF